MSQPDGDESPGQADGDALADTALTADPEHPGHYHATVTESWRIFQAFGGITFGIAHRAALEHLHRPDLAPVTASAVFCAPVPPGPVTVEVEVLRNGRTAAQVVADLRVPGRDGTALRLQATFGRPQTHDLTFTDAVFPDDAGSPEDWAPPPPRPDDDPFGDIPWRRRDASVTIGLTHSFIPDQESVHHVTVDGYEECLFLLQNELASVTIFAFTLEP